MAHVYISYAPENYEFAEVVQLRVERAGFPVWIDSAPAEIPDDITGAKNWRQEIDDAIRDSFAVIAIVTPQAKVFEYVNYEWMFALGFGVKVIPLLFEPTELPARLKPLTTLDFCHARQRPWDRLMAQLHQIQNHSQADRSNTLPPSPQRPHDIQRQVRSWDGQAGHARTLLDLMDILRGGDSESQLAALRALVDIVHEPLLKLVQTALRSDEVRLQFTQELIEIGLPLPPARHVFLSYSRRDTSFMLRLRDDMRAANLQVWTDESLTPGDPSWQLAIEEALENAGCVVVILSPDAKKSEWVLAELQYARMHKIVIVPVLLRGTEAESVPMAFVNSQWLDFRSAALYQAGLQRLLSALQMYLQRLEERRG